MIPIATIFFDIGGVLLTDGWDRASRQLAARKFGLDWDEYSQRHEKVAHEIETNRLTLEQYLDFAIFDRPRLFTREEFHAFMFAQSQAKPETIQIAQEVSESHKFFMATINNEIMELNVYRLAKFGLRRYFSAFFSSCFMGIRKPDEPIYRTVLSIVQRYPEECLFIDDREENLDVPRKLGMQTIQFRDAGSLRASLHELNLI
jgi:putative hydrolase of the HAD superfamily